MSMATSRSNSFSTLYMNYSPDPQIEHTHCIPGPHIEHMSRTPDLYIENMCDTHGLHTLYNGAFLLADPLGIYSVRFSPQFD
jgi:hypothetical protein